MSMSTHSQWVDHTVTPPQALYDCGYSATDIIVTLFRVVRNSTTLNEFVKLEFLKVLTVFC